MARYELVVPAGDVVSVVESAASELGLRIQRGTLAKYAGCTHWHFKLPGRTGTLEATWWPLQQRLWLDSRDNRAADWHASAISHFQARFR